MCVCVYKWRKWARHHKGKGLNHVHTLRYRMFYPWKRCWLCCCFSICTFSSPTYLPAFLKSFSSRSKNLNKTVQRCVWVMLNCNTLYWIKITHISQFMVRKSLFCYQNLLEFFVSIFNWNYFIKFCVYWLLVRNIISSAQGLSKKHKILLIKWNFYIKIKHFLWIIQPLIQ